MPASVKVAGVWRTFSPRMKIGGVWKNATGGWVKVAGTWRKFFSSQATGITELNNGFDTNTGNKQYNVTAGQAAAGDRLIALVQSSGVDVDLTAMSDTLGGTWVKCVSAKISTTRGCAIWLRTEPLTGVALTVQYASGASTGCGMSVRTVQGAPGLTLRQVGFTNDSGSAAPAATFPAPPSPDSVMMSIAVMPAGTPTIPAGWGYGFGITYTVPTTTVRVASRLSGETSQTISYTGAVVNASTCIAEFSA